MVLTTVCLNGLWVQTHQAVDYSLHHYILLDYESGRPTITDYRFKELQYTELGPSNICRLNLTKLKTRFLTPSGSSLNTRYQFGPNDPPACFVNKFFLHLIVYSAFRFGLRLSNLGW